MIEWQDLHHSELSVSQLYALLQLRCAVFVVEQNCPYQDIDGDDLTGDNRHILGWKNDELVAGNDSNLLIVFYVQIMPDDFVMQLHRF